MAAWNGSSGYSGVVTGVQPLLTLSDGTTFTQAQVVATIRGRANLGINENIVVGDVLTYNDGTAAYTKTKPKDHGR